MNDLLDEDDRLREPLLRKVLMQPVVHGSAHVGIDSPSLHVYLHSVDLDVFACVILALKDSPGGRSGFWWQAVDQTWPDFDVQEAMRQWCMHNFSDLPVPQFVIEKVGQ